jgi:glycosyltransferase involved in cell wall biosynthesis
LINPPIEGKIRVVRLFSRLNIGGPSLHVILLTAGLAARGYDTRLLIGHEGESEGNMNDFAGVHGVDLLRVDGLGREVRLFADARVVWKLYRYMRAFRPTIVHTHTAKAGFVGRVAALMAGVPVVVHTFHGHVLRGYFGPLKTAFYRGLERTLAAFSTSVIAVSETVKRDLVALGVAKPSKIRVIELGLPLEALGRPLPRGILRGAIGVASETPLIGIVGRLVPIKDVGTFLQAAALMRDQAVDAHFAVVGDGDQRAPLEDLARSLQLEGCVHFFGWRRDLEAVYGDLDLVVNCSRNEGTPVSLIEALAAGRPVVATRVGGTPDVIGDGERGVLVPPGDPAALAQAITAALRDPQAAHRKAAAGQAYVMARHSVGRLVADVDALYRELMPRAVPAA